ncbi:MAG: glycosyltransferase [Candidatus Diapherotrites archaeon]|nr:glycosyltransferase [Candidatus Diapherotrites archaeon]
MKIAMFTETFFPQVNGVVTSVAAFTEELVNQGHDVEVFTAADRNEDYAFDAAPVHEYKSVTFRPYPQYRMALFPVAANKVVKQGGFDVVHTHGPFSMGWAGVYCAKRNHLPLVSTFHTPVSDYVPYLFGKHKRLVYLGKKAAWSYCRSHYHYYNKLIVPSRVIKQLLEEEGVDRPIDVIRTGINLDRLDRIADSASVREKYGIDGDFILHAGRLSHEKNVDTIIEAMPRMLEDFPELKLVVTSGGPAKDSLERQAKELGLAESVVFTGYIPWSEWDDIIRLCAEAEVFVIASEAETQGMVIYEAMSRGTPAVGADYLAVPETIKDGENGLLFKLYDSDELAQRVTEVLSDKELRARLSKGARRTAEENTIQRWTEKLAGLYGAL